MSMLDNLAESQDNDWLSQKLNDNPEEDQALQTTARVMTAHIWPFLASAISDDDYRARRGVKEDEVRYMCATVAPHVASTLTSYVLAGFDADYDLLRKTAQEEGLLADELLPALLGSGEGGGDSDGGDDDPKPWETPGTVASLHQAQGDPEDSPTTLLPSVEHHDEEDDGDGDGGTSTMDTGNGPKFLRVSPSGEPKPWETPGTDANLGTGYYSQSGAGSTINRDSALHITIDRYGHINLGAYDPSRDPQRIEDPDPDQERSEAENRAPEADIDFDHDEPEYEADWESAPHSEGDYRGGARRRNPKTSAEKEEKGTVPCPICHKKFEPDELAEHMRTVHGVKEGDEDEHEKKPPGSARSGQSKAKPSAGRQTHKPAKHSSKEAQLARSAQRPLGARRSPVMAEMGYDPSEAFPGYYGTAEPPRRPRTAQAPLSGNSDVPSDPESDTGASGSFNPGGALNVATPGGTVDTDFSQQDEPQDIQAQLGQVPTLSHKIGAKLAEMATEALTYNPGLSALAAMELSLQVLRLYPKVAAGGTDYLAEPGTEGVPTEVLEECPQCQWEAYNRQINRCHNCGFWDNALEASIEIT
jgi:hypothetical protein